MDTLLLTQLLSLLVLAFLTVKSDLKERKIKNYHLLFSIALFVISSMMVCNDRFKAFYTNFEFWRSFLIISAYVVLLYGLGIFAPGDAKLILVTYFLFPHQYFTTYTKPLIRILLIYFLIVSVSLVVMMLKKLKWKQIKTFAKKSFDPKRLWRIFLFIYSLNWIVSKITNFISFYIYVPYLPLFSFLLLFALYSQFSFIEYYEYALIIIAILRTLLSHRILDDLVFTVVTTFVFMFVRYFINLLAYSVFTKNKMIEKLLAGDWLAEKIVVKPKELYDDFDKQLLNKLKPNNKVIFMKLPDIVFSRFDMVRQLFLPSVFPINRPLNKEEVEKLQYYHKTMQFRDHFIRVHITMPFAHYYFIILFIYLVIAFAFHLTL